MVLGLASLAQLLSLGPVRDPASKHKVEKQRRKMPRLMSGLTCMQHSCCMLHCTGQASWLSSFQTSPCLPPLLQLWDSKCGPLSLSLSSPPPTSFFLTCVLGNLNSASHTCEESILMTEPSSPAQKLCFSKKF